ncbi:hypothetical protein HK101_001761, partial [Irineochytrium annulatum]
MASLKPSSRQPAISVPHPSIPTTLPANIQLAMATANVTTIQHALATLDRQYVSTLTTSRPPATAPLPNADALLDALGKWNDVREKLHDGSCCICLEAARDGVSDAVFGACACHWACAACLRQYVESRRSCLPAPCPGPGCERTVTVEILKRVRGLKSSFVERVERRSKAEGMIKDGTAVRCGGCGGAVKRTPRRLLHSRKIVLKKTGSASCSCGLKVCLGCGYDVHCGLTCAEWRREMDEDEPGALQVKQLARER